MPFPPSAEVTVLDGGLATQLEASGHDLSDALWSARLLADDPDAIVAAHLAPAEIGEVRPQRLVGGEDMLLGQISDHRTASSGVTTAPVKVEPVVPVSRTS